LLLFVLGLFCRPAAAALPDLQAAQGQLLSGNYTGCVAVAETALREGLDPEEWSLLLTDALLTMGRYPQARTVVTNALATEFGSIRLRWRAREVFLSNGETNLAAQLVEEIAQFATMRFPGTRSAAELVAFGQAALAKGVDPKTVLTKLFDVARKATPAARDVYLASGGLALDKHDFELAAKTFQEGLKQQPDDPDLHFGLARAYAPSDAGLMLAAVEAALQRNSNHVGSLLLLADHTIDAEDYAGTEKLLDRVQSVNPWQPEAWAYRAVLAELRNQPQAKQPARQTALKFWPTNPRVDYLIGLKLSQKYRFAEGSAHQRQALQFDGNYLPAKAQLAQDLLRLGDEAEGWRLADEVQKQDGYDVAAYNLTTLHDTMGKFATLTNGDFVLRMSAHEASVYGSRVLEFLGQARTNLCGKYGIELKRPTILEVFPEQKDFAVRTFGMPGNPGYLGVCFGRVVTANSPASHPGHAVNWQAVLWHEFAHVVTLQLTRNKMPRWLSEGISVYEESQANPTWGQRMNPRYREMILEDELTPVSKLSAAFLAPPSEIHLQFAYYEASLVVEYLVQRFGLDALQAILRDLGTGAEINQALTQHTEPIAKLDQDFAAFARDRAEKLAPGLDFAQPDLGVVAAAGPRSRPPARSRTNAPPTTSAATNTLRSVPSLETTEAAWAAWARNRPTNFWVLTRQAQQFVERKQWAEARPILQRLVELYPGATGSESASSALAAAHRGLGETNAERQVLARLAERDAAALAAYLRLMELGAQAQDWPTVIQNAQRYLAVDPLVAPPYRFLAQAADQTGDTQAAIGANCALLQFDPADPTELHFHLAQLLQRAGDPAARRQVLQALEEAPRYRAALQLLLELDGAARQAKAPAPTGSAKP
jgi:tetratricopeptide (TPR) repeat protein